MKKEFIGYYRPTKSEKDTAWNDGVFIFDTSALLNLYRYSKETRDDFLNSLDKIKERIHLPHHVALEFHKNRHSVIQDAISKYKLLIDDVKETFKKNIDQHFNQVKKHPSINTTPLKEISDNFIHQLEKELDKQKRTHPDYNSKDIILDKLTDIYENKIGRPFDEKELEDIYKKGNVRYEKGIPPGFKDATNKKDNNKFGDLIVWKSIIKYAKENKQPIILVTDDQKEDWWTIEKGIAIRPREELIKEFFDETGIRILIYNADRFLRGAKKRKLIIEVEDKTIEEISKVKQYRNYDFSNFNQYLKDLEKITQLSDASKYMDLSKYITRITTNKYLDLKHEAGNKPIDIIRYLNDIKNKTNDEDNEDESLVLA